MAVAISRGLQVQEQDLGALSDEVAKRGNAPFDQAGKDAGNRIRRVRADLEKMASALGVESRNRLAGIFRHARCEQRQTTNAGTQMRASHLLLLLFALSATGCVSEDLPPQPGYVSNGHSGVASVAPSVTGSGRGAMATNSSGYFVEFRSRYALSYGHTYVAFGRLNQAGRAANLEIAGLHPASNSEVPYVLGHFVPVPAETGASDGDLEEQYRSASWRVMLNQAEYNNVVAHIRKLQDTTRLWQASVYNCNAFTGDIARFMGYKVPSKYLRPQQFVTELREMNTGPGGRR